MEINIMRDKNYVDLNETHNRSKRENIQKWAKTFKLDEKHQTEQNFVHLNKSNTMIQNRKTCPKSRKHVNLDGNINSNKL